MDSAGVLLVAVAAAAAAFMTEMKINYEPSAVG